MGCTAGAVLMTRGRILKTIRRREPDRPPPLLSSGILLQLTDVFVNQDAAGLRWDVPRVPCP